jgi:hypothetical protein
MFHKFLRSTTTNQRKIFLTSCALGSTFTFTKTFYSLEPETLTTYSSIDVTKKNFNAISQQVS